MNKEEQIKEMAEIAELELMIHFGGGDIVEPEDRPIQAESIAEAFYNAGYGDTKQAVKEFAEKLKEKVEKAEEEIVPKGCDSYFKNGAMCCQSIIFLILDELVKEVCGD